RRGELHQRLGRPKRVRIRQEKVDQHGEHLPSWNINHALRAAEVVPAVQVPAVFEDGIVERSAAARIDIHPSKVDHPVVVAQDDDRADAIPKKIHLNLLYTPTVGICRIPVSVTSNMTPSTSTRAPTGTYSRSTPSPCR